MCSLFIDRNKYIWWTCRSLLVFLLHLPPFSLLSPSPFLSLSCVLSLCTVAASSHPVPVLWLCAAFESTLYTPPPPEYNKTTSTPVSPSTPSYPPPTPSPSTATPPTPPLRHSASRFATSLGSAFHPVLPHYATIPRRQPAPPTPPPPVLAPPPAPASKSVVWTANNFTPLPPSPPVMISSPPGKATGPRPMIAIPAPSPLSQKPPSPISAPNGPPTSLHFHASSPVSGQLFSLPPTPPPPPPLYSPSPTLPTRSPCVLSLTPACCSPFSFHSLPCLCWALCKLWVERLLLLCSRAALSACWLPQPAG